jgi:ATP-dependent RNA helicase DeaD
VSKFLGRITTALESDGLAMFRDLVERYEREQNVPAVEIAAALAKLVQGDMPLLLQATAEKLRPAGFQDDSRSREGSERGPRGSRSGFERTGPDRGAHREQWAPAPARAAGPRRNDGEAIFGDEAPAPRQPREERRESEAGMETFRIEVGHRHGVKPGNIVGAIANESDLESRYIGRIDIRDDHSLIDLPEGMPREVMEHLKRVRVAGQPLLISRPGEGAERPHRHGDGDPRPPRGPRPGGPGPRKFKPRPR